MDISLTPIEKFPGIWQGMQAETLEPLFSLANEIEKEYQWVDKCMGRVLTTKNAQAYYNLEGFDTRFLDCIKLTGLCVGFDWEEWKDELKDFKNNRYEDLILLNPLTLCKILTVLAMSEKETPGGISSRLQDKFLFALIKAIRHQFENKMTYSNTARPS
ncbi:hypothetical protein KIH41_05895 [Litoribacter ruber]|uniref:Uncharacterized protein n=1 Tax=Litoribacter ruber TaxID=702568 RepID=A0AAP2G0V9_9BACT|nr:MULTISPECIES: DUF6508 domain-containing protein [Litoribacter]MBS9523027.1 hypothetical protein [Litoribacter alkaliphilus]MBT0810809.1 hypothetical protein [Litoribacter ruber]